MMTNSHAIISNQQITNDDSVRCQHYIQKKGKYSQDNRPERLSLQIKLYSDGNGGEIRGDDFILVTGI